MLRILMQFCRLLRPCLQAAGGKVTLCLFIAAVILNLAGVYVGVRMTLWSGDFYSAIEKIDTEQVVAQIIIFVIIVGLNSVRSLTHEYIRKIVQMRWRKALTDHTINLWTTNKTYWYLANIGTKNLEFELIDNPDQRIAEDCALFINGLLGQALDLIGKIAGLFSYVILLWNLANFPLVLPIGDFEINIPRYMVWTAFLYVFVSSLFTHYLGRPLKNLIYEQQHYEADFRFSLARWRGSFDEIALSSGEEVEREILKNRFAAIVGNWRQLIKREVILGCFTYPFRHTVLRIPLFVALPGYLSGHVAFGGLMQVSVAFSNVVTTLSWFIFAYRSLADLVATSSRLDQFLQAVHHHKAQPQNRENFDNIHGDKKPSFSNLTIFTPQGQKLLENQTIELAKGEAVWLHGRSGLGKTTLVKTLAGLWPNFRGQIDWPAEQTIFLPQRPYFPSGTILQAAVYPAKLVDFEEEDIKKALLLVGLGSDEQLMRLREPEKLSNGERQRLSLARLLMHRPQWVVLDEATSALDEAAEASLFAMLRAQLPQTAFLIIAHRQPLGLELSRTIKLD